MTKNVSSTFFPINSLKTALISVRSSVTSVFSLAVVLIAFKIILNSSGYSGSSRGTISPDLSRSNMFLLVLPVLIILNSYLQSKINGSFPFLIMNIKSMIKIFKQDFHPRRYCSNLLTSDSKNESLTLSTTSPSPLCNNFNFYHYLTFDE